MGKCGCNIQMATPACLNSPQRCNDCCWQLGHDDPSLRCCVNHLATAGREVRSQYGLPGIGEEEKAPAHSPRRHRSGGRSPSPQRRSQASGAAQSVVPEAMWEAIMGRLDGLAGRFSAIESRIEAVEARSRPSSRASTSSRPAPGHLARSPPRSPSPASPSQAGAEHPRASASSPPSPASSSVTRLEALDGEFIDPASAQFAMGIRARSSPDSPRFAASQGILPSRVSPLVESALAAQSVSTPTPARAHSAASPVASAAPQPGPAVTLPSAFLLGNLSAAAASQSRTANTGVIDPFAASHNAAPLSREEFIEEFLQQSRGLQKASRKYKSLQELLDFLSFTVRRLRIQDPLKAVSMMQYMQFVSDASTRWEAPEAAVLDYHYKFVQSQYDFDPAVRADVFAVGGFRHAESMRGTLLLWERQYEELQCSRKYGSSASAAAKSGSGKKKSTVSKSASSSTSAGSCSRHPGSRHSDAECHAQKKSNSAPTSAPPSKPLASASA